MSARSKFDFIVIGGGLPGLAAACCAARRGAEAALALTGHEAPVEGRVAEPSTSLWRLLELHQYELVFEPPPQHVSLLEEGALATGDDPARVGRSLAARNPELEQLWPAYAKEMARGGDKRRDGLERFLSANALLDDYFDDEALKAHLVAAYVAPFGLSGDEAGSAEALFPLGGRRQRFVSGVALMRALTQAAEAAGVEIVEDRLHSIARGEGKSWRVNFEGGRDIRARTAMASSAFAAEAFGLCVTTSGSPLARRKGVGATIRLKYEKKPQALADWNGAVFHIADDRASLRVARDKMIEGALPEAPPLSFEVNGKDIIARMHFCPSRLVENGEAREWTGQDRQVLGRCVAGVLEKRLAVPVEVSEVLIGPDVEGGLARRDFLTPAIPAPPPSLDPINAAAALAWELTERE